MIENKEKEYKILMDKYLLVHSKLVDIQMILMNKKKESNKLMKEYIELANKITDFYK